MPTTGLKILALLAGGTALGAALASYADPVPRQPEAWPVQLSARPEIGPVPSVQFVELGPEDLSPPSEPDGYAPEWAADDGESVWQYPAPALAAWEPTPYPSLAELEAQRREDAALLDTAAQSARLAASAAPAPVAAPGPAEAPASTEARLAALY